MKYGFVFPYGDARTVAQFAHQAEQAGWDGFFVWEPVWGIDAWICMAAAAMRTERIRLGTLLSPLSRMRPWKLASESATLDNLVSILQQIAEDKDHDTFELMSHPAVVDDELMRTSIYNEKRAEELKLLSHGMTDQEIAHQLFVSEITVRTHISRIVRKLGFQNRVQAVLYSLRSGLVPESEVARVTFGQYEPK